MHLHNLRWRRLLLPCTAAIMVTPAARSLAQSPTVVKGTDVYQLDGVATETFAGIGPVEFESKKKKPDPPPPPPPPYPGNADTIVQRLADGQINGPSIPVQITYLTLVNVAPVYVPIAHSLFNVTLELDPAHLADDIGTMSISGTSAGGSFVTDSLDAYTIAHFQQISGSVQFDVSDLLALSSGPAAWSPLPGAGDALIFGPAGDQNVNSHTGLTPDQSDFFPASYQLGSLTLSPATVTPEPGDLGLLAAGGLIIGMSLRRRGRR